MKKNSFPYRGYIEGYYGRVLTWHQRAELIAHCQHLGFDSYFYAPKSDPYHRQHWRTPYDTAWLDAFTAFCHTAHKSGISILAGIAPGLDFNYSEEYSGNTDYTHLKTKARQLLNAGADHLVIMFDDIDERGDEKEEKRGEESADTGNSNEGADHAKLTTRLALDLHHPPFFVPRLYADEIAGDHDAYARDLRAHLHPDCPLFICGKAIIAARVNRTTHVGRLGAQIPHSLIIWDNLYCQDYCPRRLFLCDYTGRDLSDPILLNGTGLVKTDQLLLSLMAGQDRKMLYTQFGIPEIFNSLHPFFDTPHVSTSPSPPPLNYNLDEVIAALDFMLWRWHSDLACEWYPFLFGLKQDILIASGKLPADRIAKTQTPPLFHYIKACS